MAELRAKASPMPMTNHMRKRLWWKATRMSFAWERWRIAQDKPPQITRQEWARIIYRIFAQSPDEALRNE